VWKLVTELVDAAGIADVLLVDMTAGGDGGTLGAAPGSMPASLSMGVFDCWGAAAACCGIAADDACCG